MTTLNMLAWYGHAEPDIVAEFIGNVNILRGTVEDATNGVARLSTSLGMMLAGTAGVAANRGMEIDFYVNADQITLSTQVQEQQENQVRAKLLGYKFVGNMVTLFLELPGGVELKVTLPEPAYDQLQIKIGDSVMAAWLASAAQLFKVTE